MRHNFSILFLCLLLAVVSSANGIDPFFVDFYHKVESLPKINKISLNIHDSSSFLFANSIPSAAFQPNWIYENNIIDANLGWSVSSAGDVNGDGFDDVIVGAPFYTNGQAEEGRVYLFTGSLEGLSTTAIWSFESNYELSRLGKAVGNAGDVNGDGFDDILIGAPNYDNTNQYGKVYAFYGSSSGLSTNANWSFVSSETWSRFGSDLSTAGDVNSDGYDDIVISAPNREKAFIFYGSPTGLPSNANLITSVAGRSVGNAGDVNNDGYDDVIVGGNNRAYIFPGSVSGLLETPIWAAEGETINEGFGLSVSTAGDVNNDGYIDVIIGAPSFNPSSGYDRGRVYLFLGSEWGINTTPNWTTQGVVPSANGTYGVSVGNAGDVNGDGFDDVIIGSDKYENTEIDEGRVLLFIGTPNGLSTNANWTFEGNQLNSNLGCSVSTAGDVNGDGISDIIVGAKLFDNYQLNEGRAFVFHGIKTEFIFLPLVTN